MRFMLTFSVIYVDDIKCVTPRVGQIDGHIDWVTKGWEFKSWSMRLKISRDLLFLCFTMREVVAPNVHVYFRKYVKVKKDVNVRQCQKLVILLSIYRCISHHTSILFWLKLQMWPKVYKYENAFHTSILFWLKLQRCLKVDKNERKYPETNTVSVSLFNLF